MKNYGSTLKMIRESLHISQNKISKGIMSQSNYSKVENGEIDIPFSKMVELLQQMGMTVDEFLYIHNDYKKTPGHQLGRVTRLNNGDKEKIIDNINELSAITNPTQREQELLAIFEALLLVFNNDYEAVDKKVSIIWKRLKKFDNWYLEDIRLINSILYLFPVEVAGCIMSLALKRLKDYKKFGKTNRLSANLQINYILLLTENKKYNNALNNIDELINFSIEANLYIHLATCYVRKGILLNILNNQEVSEWYEKGFELLEVTNNQGLIQELKNEINLYTNN